jgi:ribosomal protein S19E (S16A)
MKLSDIQAAAKAYIEATRNDVVPDAEIDRRARICRQCSLRVPTRGVGRVSQILGGLANKHRVPKELSDYSCQICKCNLQLLIPAKDGHVDSPDERRRRIKGNKHCWVLTSDPR